MAKFKYKPGDAFGYWTLLEYIGPNGKWLAKCTCGKEKEVWISHLTLGRSISCSCEGKSTHKMTGSPEYRSWSSAKKRCTNPNDDRYAKYGGRGICMCDRWLNSFEAFYEDMGPRPEGTSIDRIDNDGHYEPGNCRWATDKEQASNTVNQKFYGMTIADYARKYDIPYGRLQTRLKRGWLLEDAIEVPLAQGYKGLERRLDMHADVYCIDHLERIVYVFDDMKDATIRTNINLTDIGLQCLAKESREELVPIVGYSFCYLKDIDIHNPPRIQETDMQETFEARKNYKEDFLSRCG